LIRRYLNGETHPVYGISCTEYIGAEKRTWRTETSQYPEEKKSTEISQVVASERERAQIPKVCLDQENGLEKPTIEGDSPVYESPDRWW
jgi:hypothetical protein